MLGKCTSESDGYSISPRWIPMICPWSWVTANPSASAWRIRKNRHHWNHQFRLLFGIVFSFTYTILYWYLPKCSQRRGATHILVIHCRFGFWHQPSMFYFGGNPRNDYGNPSFSHRNPSFFAMENPQESRPRQESQRQVQGQLRLPLGVSAFRGRVPGWSPCVPWWLTGWMSPWIYMDLTWFHVNIVGISGEYHGICSWKKWLDGWMKTWWITKNMREHCFSQGC